MIFLTDYKTIFSDRAELLSNIAHPQKVHWIPEMFKNLRTGLVYPPHKMVDAIINKDFIDKIKSKDVKTAFILAAGNTHFVGMNPPQHVESSLYHNYKLLPMSLTQVFAGRVAQTLGVSDLIITDSSACASSLKVMTDVRFLIEGQGFERVIVLAVEDQISDTTLQFFSETGASLTANKEEKTGQKPSAFDKINGGFYVGQGCAVAIFESSKTADSAHAKLLGSGIAGENSNNVIGQRADGQGFINAAVQAFKSAQLSPIDIDLVKTHGTGTESNNTAEKNALYRLFDTPFQATSYKQLIGHTLGASGLLETCIMIDDLKKGLIKGIPNRTNYDEFFLSQDNTCARKEQKILSLAAGMGNIYAAAIFDTAV